MKTQVNWHRTMSFIVALSAIVGFSTSVLAVEDGLGTNVVKNLRVVGTGYLDVPYGSIRLNGVEIMDWDDLSTDIEWDSMQTSRILSNKVAGIEFATNSLNLRVGTLQDNTNALNGRVTAIDAATTGTVAVLQIATNTLNTATNALQGQVTSLQDATNALNGRVNAIDAVTTGTVAVLQIATNTLNSIKYDKAGGPISGDVNISGNVTMSNKVVYVPVAAAVVAGTSIDSGQAIKTISSVGDIVMTINPPIAVGTAGQMITLLYTGGGSVGFTNSPGLVLDGGVGFTMKVNDVLQCVSDGNKWIEIHRADNQ